METNNNLIRFNVKVLFELNDVSLEDITIIHKAVNRINKHREKIKTKLIDGNNLEVMLNE